MKQTPPIIRFSVMPGRCPKQARSRSASSWDASDTRGRSLVAVGQVPWHVSCDGIPFAVAPREYQLVGEEPVTFGAEQPDGQQQSLRRPRGGGEKRGAADRTEVARQVGTGGGGAGETAGFAGNRDRVPVDQGDGGVAGAGCPLAFLARTKEHGEDPATDAEDSSPAGAGSGDVDIRVAGTGHVSKLSCAGRGGNRKDRQCR